jgi:hypothetical protein
MCGVFEEVALSEIKLTLSMTGDGSATLILQIFVSST